MFRKEGNWACLMLGCNLLEEFRSAKERMRVESLMMEQLLRVIDDYARQTT
jgi:UDP-N-acetylmuramate-alanine ligase